MKIKVDNQDVFELAEWEKKVIQHEIPTEMFEDDMKRRLHYILKHKVERCYESFEKEWMQKLRDDPQVTSIPKSKEEFVNMVMARPDYKNRSQRDVEAANLT